MDSTPVQTQSVAEQKNEQIELKKKKEKKTFMLHHPDTFASLGKFVSTDFRYAALKAASRGHKKILLRITDTKLVYEFQGDIVELEIPQIVKRGEREISYNKKPTVKFVQKFIYNGPVKDDVLEDAETKPKKPKRSKPSSTSDTNTETATATDA